MVLQDHGLLCYLLLDENGYLKNLKSSLVGFTNAGYLSDSHKARSQISYVFKCNDIAISWHSRKQTITAASSNHVEILVLHKTSWECIWLKSMIQDICKPLQIIIKLRKLNGPIWRQCIIYYLSLGRLYKGRQNQTYFPKVIFHTWITKEG